MTPLGRLIAAQIAQQGPISLADYMALCLSHPDHGYYMSRRPFGAQGDFVTAPEISQMFGELTGLALAQAWLDQGSPAPFVLAELGPGRGTAMRDMLRATRGVPGFHDAMRPWLVETSPNLCDVQRDTLTGWAVNWADSLDALPDGPLFMLANEFFDALPIRQFQFIEAAWHERMVALSADRTSLRIGLGPAVPASAVPARLREMPDLIPDGAIVETCAPGAAIAAQIGQRIATHGGAALIIDYGGEKSAGDTFQAVQDHRIVDPLAAPGMADLTAHVDFSAVADAARLQGADASPLTPQGVFLERLGITERANILARSLTADALQNHVAAHHRLTHKDEMGSLFKCLAVFPEGAPPPPGVMP